MLTTRIGRREPSDSSFHEVRAMRFACSLAFPLVALNIAAAPTPSPTTRPAKVNLSTPETAFWSYVDAVEQGDLGAEEQIVARLTEDDRRAHRESVAMQLAAQRLVVVTRDRLGEDVARKV